MGEAKGGAGNPPFPRGVGAGTAPGQGGGLPPREPGSSGGGPGRLSSREGALAAAVFLLALALRLVFLSQFSDCLLFSSPTGDPRDYHLRALEILGGDWLGSGIPFHSSPLYPYLMAFVFALTGGSFYALYLLQSLLGAANCVLIFLLARRIPGPRAATAAVAGLTAALYGTLAFFDGIPLMIGITIFFADLALLLLVKHHETAKLRFALLGGVALGLAALDKTNLLLFAPAAFLFVLSGLSLRAKRRSWKAALLFAAATAGTVLPVTARNWVVGRDLVLVSSNAGVNFFIGNNPNGKGYFNVDPRDGLTDPGLYESSKRTAEQALGRELRPSEVSRWWGRRGWAFILGQPLAWIRNTGTKLLLLLNRYEMPNYVGFDFVRDWFAPALRAMPAGFWLVMPLSLLGMALRIRRGPTAAERLYLAFLGCYALTLLLFFVTARYRLPLVPLMIVFSAAALTGAAAGLRKPSRRGIALGGLILAAAGAAGSVPFDRATYVLPLGELANAHVRRSQEDPGAAERHLEEASLLYRWALEVEPGAAYLRHNLGQAYESLGWHSGAVEEYRAALRRDPQFDLAARKLSRAAAALRAGGDAIAPGKVPRTPFEEASALRAEGRRQEAEGLLRGVVRRDPFHYRAFNDLGEILASRGDLRGARRAFERSIEGARLVREPFTAPYENLSRLYRSLGREDRAQEALDRARRAAGTRAP